MPWLQLTNPAQTLLSYTWSSNHLLHNLLDNIGTCASRNTSNDSFNPETNKPNNMGVIQISSVTENQTASYGAHPLDQNPIDRNH